MSNDSKAPEKKPVPIKDLEPKEKDAEKAKGGTWGPTVVGPPPPPQ